MYMECGRTQVWVGCSGGVTQGGAGVSLSLGHSPALQWEHPSESPPSDSEGKCSALGSQLAMQDLVSGRLGSAALTFWTQQP